MSACSRLAELLNEGDHADIVTENTTLTCAQRKSPSWGELVDSLRLLAEKKLTKTQNVKVANDLVAVVARAERDGHFLVNQAAGLVGDAIAAIKDDVKKESTGSLHLMIVKQLVVVPAYAESLPLATCSSLLEVCQSECLDWMTTRASPLLQCRGLVGTIWSHMVSSQPALVPSALKFFINTLSRCEKRCSFWSF